MGRVGTSQTAFGVMGALTLIVALAPMDVAAQSDVAKADPNKLAYGKHLAQECTTCHRLDGSGTNIPPIIGLKADYFITTMKFYKSGARENSAMNSVAQMLGDEQLEALAAYFETVKPPAKASGRKR